MTGISLCMIVKNEEKVLSRCLESVKELVDEIVIVDTGSVDRTKDIAGQYTKKVFDFAWRDDFSAARNFAFDQAKMEYLMWLDADDVVPKKTREVLKEWKVATDGKTDVLMIKYATGFDEKGEISFSYYRERILKKKNGYRFKGRVHEAIPYWGKVQYLDCAIEHRSVKRDYSTRNLDIYERMKAEGQLLEPRDVFYYARELYYHGKNVEAVENFEKFLRMKGAFVENQVEACRLAAYTSYRLGDEERALDFLMRGLVYRVPGGELCCDIGKHFFDRKNWKQAIFWYECAERSVPDERSGGFVNLDCYGYLPCLQLCVCYQRIGQMEKALEYHDRAGKWRPNGEIYLRNEEYFKKFR